MRSIAAITSLFAGSSLARLALFKVCLSIAGSIVAGAHSIAVDWPAQNAVKVPANIVIDGTDQPRPTAPSPAAPAPSVRAPGGR